MKVEDLDTLEDILLKNLKGEAEEGKQMSAATLDLTRKILEKNNRLYVKPRAKDCMTVLDAISSTDPADSPCDLPFGTKH